MGLDITAHETLTPAPYKTFEETDEHWKDDSPAIWLGDGYDKRRRDDLQEGAYFPTGERIDFRAGSYSGYNYWRSELAKMLGTTDRAIWDGGGEGLPFVEMINFTDCDGVVGPRTSAKLAADFEANRGKAKAHAESLTHGDSEWFMRVYEDFAKAFAIAARGGCVRFH